MADKLEHESSTAEIQRRIRKAFDIFDHESNKTVDVRTPHFGRRNNFPKNTNKFLLRTPYSAAHNVSDGSDTFVVPKFYSNEEVVRSDIRREIGTIVRSLNCCPSEGELNDILSEVEEEEPTGYIRFEKFEPVMLRILIERKYRPATEEQLLKAFEVLDSEKKEHLAVEEIHKLMTEEGEPFTQEEMEEMLSAAVDPDKGSVYYKDYISLMVVDDDGTW